MHGHSLAKSKDNTHSLDNLDHHPFDKLMGGRGGRRHTFPAIHRMDTIWDCSPNHDKLRSISVLGCSHKIPRTNCPILPIHISYHKLSRLHYVRATAEDAKNTAEANHSDKRGWNYGRGTRSGWSSKHTPGGYANYEQFRNGNFFGTL